MRHTKTIACLISALLICTAAAGCSSGQDGDSNSKSSSPSGTPSKTEGAVDVWTWEPYDNQKEVIADFNKAYPDIKINFTTITAADMPMKVQTALASNSEIGDAIWCEISQRGKLMALDCWENLEEPPYSVNRQDMLDFMIPLSVTPDDKLVGIEVSPPVAGLAYKRALAKEYFGTDDPTELGKLISDWDALIEKGVEIKEKSDGTVFMFMNGENVSQITRFQNTNPYIDGDTLNLKASLGDTLDKIIEMKQKGIIDNLEVSSPAANAAYTTDNYLFYPCATWSPTWEFKANDPDGIGDWGFTTPPGGGYLRGGTVVAIPKSAKHKEEAFQYLQWNYLSKEGAVSNRDHLDYFSVYKPVYDDASFFSREDEFFGGQDVLKAFAQDLIPAVSVPRAVNKYDQEVLDALTVALKEIDNSKDGNVDTEKLFSDMSKDILNKVPELKEE